MGSEPKFKHNKKRNSGLVYEFLIRKMSQCLIEQDSPGYKTALRLLKRYYAEGTPLGTEKKLFDAIVGTTGVSEKVATGILNEVREAANDLINFRLSDIKKSNLIKEIHKVFGKKFFSDYRFENYRAYASAQLFINGCNKKRTLTESVQRVQLEEALIRYMTYRPNTAQDETASVDNLSYSIAVKKFNERYGKTLSESQKNLLKSYIISFAEENGQKKLSKYLNEQRNKLLFFMQGSHTCPEITGDKNMLKKLKEAELMLEKMDFADPNSDSVEDLMLYCRLVEEMSSNG